MRRTNVACAMSNRSLNLLWEEAIQNIKEIVDEEQAFELRNVTASGCTGKKGKKKSKPPSSKEKFDRFARLYIRYRQILSKLEKCHDGIVQPQKRQDIKDTLELVICRIVDLRRNLVELSSRICAENKGSSNTCNEQQPFPECIDIGNILQSMEISPSEVEAVVPRYFREESLKLRQQMNVHINQCSVEDCTDVESVHEQETSDDADVESTANIPIESDDVQASTDDPPPNKSTLSEEDAAAKMQSLIRGSIGRAGAKRHREQEKVFLGIATDQSNSNQQQLQAAYDYNYTRRKQTQLENSEVFDSTLNNLRGTVREEEGSDMQERLYNERIQWVMEQITATQNVPESLEGYYLKDATNMNGEDKDKIAADAKSAKGKKSAADASSKNTKEKNAKAGPSEDDEVIDNKAEQLLSSLLDTVNIFEGRWKGKLAEGGHVGGETYDLELAKDTVVRPEVESAITQAVDESVLTYLQRIKDMNSDGSGAKSKKGKGGGAAKKGKSGKKGGKKEKPLPGEKIAGSIATPDMMDFLVSNKMVNDCSRSQARIQDFIGSSDAFNPTSFQANTGAGIGPEGDGWNRANPTANQLQAFIIEQCILPNGSSKIKDSISNEENVRSVMLYGPKGSGKRRMVEAIGYHLGAILITLSPKLLEDKYLDKSEATRLIHMVFAVARDEPNHGPVIIHIEECDQFFLPASGKHVAKSGPVRFQKDLITYKNQALKKNDRVIIIGTTAHPELTDNKVVKWKGPSCKPDKQGFFERFAYFPPPSYVDRLLLWKTYANEQDKMSVKDNSKVQAQSLRLDLSLLAMNSEGYTAESIRTSAERILSSEQSQCISATPKGLEQALLTQLKTYDSIGSDDEKRYIDFARIMDEQKSTGGKAGEGKDSDKKKKK